MYIFLDVSVRGRARGAKVAVPVGRRRTRPRMGAKATVPVRIGRLRARDYINENLLVS
jgi:hypothetical protein